MVEKAKQAGFLLHDAMQSAVMPQYVCLSVCLSVRDVKVPWSHTLLYFKNNFTAEYLEAPAHIDPTVGDLVRREHPQN